MILWFQRPMTKDLGIKIPMAGTTKFTVLLQQPEQLMYPE